MLEPLPVGGVGIWGVGCGGVRGGFAVRSGVGTKWLCTSCTALLLLLTAHVYHLGMMGYWLGVDRA